MATFELASRPETPGGSGLIGHIVKTNCFRVSVTRALAYHRYDVKIPDRAKPGKEIKAPRRRRDIVTKLYVEREPQVFQPGRVIFDGKASLFTEKDLGFASRNFEVPMTNTAGTRPIRVELTMVGFVQSNDFHQAQGDNASYMQQILNLLCFESVDPAHRQRSTRTTMFSGEGARPIRASNYALVVWFGCFANIRPSLDQSCAILNLDTASTVMYAPMDLISTSLALLGQPVNNPLALENPSILSRLRSLLKGIRVKQKTAGKTGRIRSIKELKEAAGNYAFTLNDGTDITVTNYFHTFYQYRLRYPKLPGISNEKTDSATGQTIVDVIPFELLELVEGQTYRRVLDPIVQAEVQSLSTRRPDKRLEGILGFLQHFQHAVLQTSGLTINRTCEQVKGRILPAPSVVTNVQLWPNNGTWKIDERARDGRTSRLHTPCIIKGWGVLRFDSSFSDTDCIKLLEDLSQSMQSLGINVDSLRRSTIMAGASNPNGNIQKDIHEILRQVKVKPAEFLILVILPSRGSSEIYRRVKEIGDTIYGVRTQCMLSSNIRSKATLKNIVLKINAKMGGKNFIPQSNPGMSWLKQGSGPAMIVGADVSHPRHGVPRPSFAGLVSSVDADASIYVASCRAQAPRVEAIQDLKEMFIGALKKFIDYNADKKLVPHRILFYRDGLSEGEYMQVAGEEIGAIDAAVQFAWTMAHLTISKPMLTYIVVGKRHHIRFFPLDTSIADRSGNCPPGFVLDSGVIMNPRFYDFYLLSHPGLIGTSRPAHYVVLKDDNKLGPDTLQGLTYGLCHSFARSTRAVSIPAPVYYADLVCNRADIHLTAVNQEMLSSLDSDLTFDWRTDYVFKDLNDTMKFVMYFT